MCKLRLGSQVADYATVRGVHKLISLSIKANGDHSWVPLHIRKEAIKREAIYMLVYFSSGNRIF